MLSMIIAYTNVVFGLREWEGWGNEMNELYFMINLE